MLILTSVTPINLKFNKVFLCKKNLNKEEEGDEGNQRTHIHIPWTQTTE